MPLHIRRRVRTQAPFLIVLLALGAALVYLALFNGHWRRGSGVIAVAMLLGGLFRMVLSDTQAGLLAVRGRWRDTVCYLVLGAVILIVAIRLH